MKRDLLIKPAASRVGRVLARLAWWRGPPKGNAVRHLDARMLRDIGLPETEVNRQRAVNELASSRDREAGMW